MLRATLLASLCSLAVGQGTYTAWQQVFGQAWSAYGVSTYTGNETYLQGVADKVIPQLMSKYGNWKPVYGPVVYKDNETDTIFGPDNVWFVSYNPSVHYVEDGKNYPTYVISIAGTDTTLADLAQDFEVTSVVNLDQWVFNGLFAPPPPVQNPPDGDTVPYISNGTAQAIPTLSRYPSPHNPTQNLFLWLWDTSRAVTVPTKFIFTGHSLGGALSVGMGVMMIRVAALSPSKLVDVRIYPLAAPSTGNTPFTKQVSQYFVGVPPTVNTRLFEAWNLNIVNTLDVIPLVWCANGDATCPGNLQIGQIPFMYMNGTTPIGNVTAAAFALIYESAQAGVPYSVTPYTTFNGISPSYIPQTSDQYGDIAYNQHTAGYCLQFFGFNPC